MVRQGFFEHSLASLLNGFVSVGKCHGRTPVGAFNNVTCKTSRPKSFGAYPALTSHNWR